VNKGLYLVLLHKGDHVEKIIKGGYGRADEGNMSKKKFTPVFDGRTA